MNLPHQKPSFRAGNARLRRAAVVIALAMMLLAVVTAVPTFAGGTIYLSSPASPYGCWLSDIPGLITIYVLHVPVTAVTGLRFRVQSGPGATLTYVSEVHPFSPTTGNTQTGITICYGGACLLEQTVVAEITYMMHGTSEFCSQLQVVPHPDAETVEEMGCKFEPIESDVQDFTLSVPPYTCPCSGVHRFGGTPKSFGCGGPVAVAATTWGRIKALYR